MTVSKLRFRYNYICIFNLLISLIPIIRCGAEEVSENDIQRILSGHDVSYLIRYVLEGQLKKGSCIDGIQ